MALIEGKGKLRRKILDRNEKASSYFFNDEML